MNEEIRKDLLAVIRDGKRIIKAEDSYALKELSNHTIHNASIFQDQYSISIAVIFYSLSKLIERCSFDTKRAIKLLDEAEATLKAGDVTRYKQCIKNIFSFISSVDSKLKLYIEQVINQAQIKKSSGMYAHGISLAQAANVLGISQWELMNYVGKTSIADVSPGKVDVKKRLMFARTLFK